MSETVLIRRPDANRFQDLLLVTVAQPVCSLTLLMTARHACACPCTNGIPVTHGDEVKGCHIGRASGYRRKYAEQDKLDLEHSRFL